MAFSTPVLVTEHGLGALMYAAVGEWGCGRRSRDIDPTYRRNAKRVTPHRFIDAFHMSKFIKQRGIPHCIFFRGGGDGCVCEGGWTEVALAAPLEISEARGRVGVSPIQSSRT